MKNACIVLVLMFISVVLVSVPSSASAASAEAGFRGTYWGVDLSARQDMRDISCEDGFCSYVRSKEDLSMGGAIVTSVTYRTLHGQFVEVVIEAPVETRQGQSPGFESENFLTLKKVCHDRFGKTSFAASFETVRAEIYRWEYTDIRKILRVNLNKNSMQLTITDYDLLKRLKDAPEKRQEALTEKTVKPEAGVEQSGETIPAPTEVTGDTSEVTSAKEGKRGTPKGLKKAAKVLRWLFVNDNPATGDDPAVQPH